MDKQNENSTPVRIKRTRGYIPLFFMLSVVLLGLSVYCVVYAYTSKMTGIPATVFYVAGVLGIVFFAYSAFDNLIGSSYCSPLDLYHVTPLSNERA